MLASAHCTDYFQPSFPPYIKSLLVCRIIKSIRREALSIYILRGTFFTEYVLATENFRLRGKRSDDICPIIRPQRAMCTAGSLVAVKVRHPGVGRVIERDFRLMTKVADCLSWYYASSGQRMSETLKQFAGPLREQVRHLPCSAAQGKFCRSANWLY